MRLGLAVQIGCGALVCAALLFGLDVRALWPLRLSALVALSAYLCVHLRASLRTARFGVLLALFAAMAVFLAFPLWGLALLAVLSLLAARLFALTGELAALASIYGSLVLWSAR